MDSHQCAAKVQIVADCGALLGEGPVWVADEQALHWVDIKTPRLWRWQWPDGQASHWDPPIRIGAIAPRASGGFVAATDRGFALLDMTTRSIEMIGDPEPELPGNRFNDAKVDQRGRLWAGTIDDAETAASGSLYRLDASLSWTRADSGYRVTNGPTFSPDGTVLYHTDSARRLIYRFALREDGALGFREIFLAFEEADGSPDGMTTDADGNIWVAFWDGGCVRCFSPDRAVLRRIDLPVSRPTSCTFGGPELDRLFITSASIGLSDAELAEQPHAGALFVAIPGVRGLETTPFAG